MSDRIVWTDRDEHVISLCSDCLSSTTTVGCANCVLLRQLPLPLVPDEAVALAVDVLGGDVAAASWFARHLPVEINTHGWQP
jgi:hypothetical protein